MASKGHTLFYLFFFTCDLAATLLRTKSQESSKSKLSSRKVAAKSQESSRKVAAKSQESIAAKSQESSKSQLSHKKVAGKSQLSRK